MDDVTISEERKKTDSRRSPAGVNSFLAMSTPPRRRSRRLASATTAAAPPSTPPPVRLLDLPTDLTDARRTATPSKPGMAMAATAPIRCDGKVTWMAFEPESYEHQLQEKTSAMRSRFGAVLAGVEVQIFPSMPAHFRQRARFAMCRFDGVLKFALFDKDAPRVAVDRFPVASREINELMPRLLAAVASSEALSTGLEACHFLGTQTGDMLVSLIYGEPMHSDWRGRSGSSTASRPFPDPSRSLPIGGLRRRRCGPSSPSRRCSAAQRELAWCSTATLWTRRTRCTTGGGSRTGRSRAPSPTRARPCARARRRATRPPPSLDPSRSRPLLQVREDARLALRVGAAHRCREGQARRRRGARAVAAARALQRERQPNRPALVRCVSRDTSMTRPRRAPQATTPSRWRRTSRTCWPSRSTGGSAQPPSTTWPPTACATRRCLAAGTPALSRSPFPRASVEPPPAGARRRLGPLLPLAAAQARPRRKGGGGGADGGTARCRAWREGGADTAGGGGSGSVCQPDDPLARGGARQDGRHPGGPSPLRAGRGHAATRELL